MSTYYRSIVRRNMNAHRGRCRFFSKWYEWSGNDSRTSPAQRLRG